jgi:hypothetical protein
MSDLVTARTVSWWPVHQLVVPVLDRVGSWPMAGSVRWVGLDNCDPAKWAAVLDAARHHALRVETAQMSLADASHAIAGAEDWAQIARETLQRSAAYIPRRAS